jgi:preprotein translocase subunit SecD
VGSQVLPYAEAAAGAPIAVKRLGGIRGDELTNAQATNDPQTNEPVVNIAFNTEGGAKFAKLTTQNVGKRFAIILDGKVMSAPVINDPDHRGQRGHFGPLHHRQRRATGDLAALGRAAGRSQGGGRAHRRA